MIFLNLLNRIFGPKKPLSRQEIDDYKDGTGNAHDTESKAANSDFNDQALEGWKTSSSSVNDGMSTTDKKMDQYVKNGNTGGSPNKGMTLSFLLFTLTMLVLIIFTYQGNSAVEKKPQIVENIKTEVENSRIKEIDFYTIISPEKQITSNELIKNQEIKKVEKEIPNLKSVKNKKVATEDKSEIEGTQTEEIQLPIQSSGKIPNSSKSSLVYKNAQEVYLSELKNVDYRAYRNRPIKVRNSLDVGIPASKSSIDDKQEFPSLQIIEFTYIDYLTSSSAYFRNEQFKKALKQYLIILDTYPDDVNANFYGGLCYFNLGKFDNSIALLKNSYTLGYGNFREEANWFSAKAHIEQGQNLKAKQLLNQIIEEGGFYHQKAKELLSEIKD
ncbi:hypothetical protein ERX46_10270 [Brumimicrobium glaciale]|uniref:Uncharacterized protein n=1 Tax=Brumimicrobium glaciale TaxID=200475 RepID=A0A4Q4KKC3_9FLAO|nr:hypothetical protein [Brumimicrobium glaciale]RYM33320.1 hypothetical protein ERX46_10270 [Brumimicrobium glaciale]